jgi:hypothetical protein
MCSNNNHGVDLIDPICCAFSHSLCSTLTRLSPPLDYSDLSKIMDIKSTHVIPRGSVTVRPGSDSLDVVVSSFWQLPHHAPSISSFLEQERVENGSHPPPPSALSRLIESTFFGNNRANEGIGMYVPSTWYCTYSTYLLLYVSVASTPRTQHDWWIFIDYSFAHSFVVGWFPSYVPGTYPRRSGPVHLLY